MKVKANEPQKAKVDFQQFTSSDDELMFLINKFDLENLTEEQLQILGNFSKLYSDLKAMKAAEK